MTEVKLLEKLYPQTGNIEDLGVISTVDQTTSGQLTPEAIDFADRDINGKAYLIPENFQKEIRKHDRFTPYIEQDVEKGVIGRLKGQTVAVRPEIENAYIIDSIQNPEKSVKILLI